MNTGNLHLCYCWGKISVSTRGNTKAHHDLFSEGAVQFAKAPVVGTSSHAPAQTAARSLNASTALGRKCQACMQLLVVLVATCKVPRT